MAFSFQNCQLIPALRGCTLQFALGYNAERLTQAYREILEDLTPLLGPGRQLVFVNLDATNCDGSQTRASDEALTVLVRIWLEATYGRLIATLILWFRGTIMAARGSGPFGAFTVLDPTGAPYRGSNRSGDPWTTFINCIKVHTATLRYLLALPSVVRAHILAMGDDGLLVAVVERPLDGPAYTEAMARLGLILKFDPVPQTNAAFCGFNFAPFNGEWYAIPASERYLPKAFFLRQNVPLGVGIAWAREVATAAYPLFHYVPTIGELYRRVLEVAPSPLSSKQRKRVQALLRSKYMSGIAGPESTKLFKGMVYPSPGHDTLDWYCERWRLPLGLLHRPIEWEGLGHPILDEGLNELVVQYSQGVLK